ncbi:FtsB family cell division protein [Pelosinus fermentans]|uniref:Septum formation initiator n=1 Tax=Pelosinus fermentans JBW45 TaxID=1192197 RepID=I9NSJ6_9FIRM|nr:septum formation initiator family protein [Pelosinus fermentans]AJQ29290.1 Septum formation initiator [Pelosinus fermentans JBW45]
MRKQQKYRVKWFKLFLFVLCSYFIYLTVGQQSQLSSIRRESQATRMQLQQLREANTALQEERKALHDPKYVEKLAREEQGLVKPGEIPFISVEKNNL